MSKKKLLKALKATGLMVVFLFMLCLVCLMFTQMWFWSGLFYAVCIVWVCWGLFTMWKVCYGVVEHFEKWNGVGKG